MEPELENDSKQEPLEAPASKENVDISFKKPALLVGKVGRLPRKVDSAGYSGAPQSSPVDYSMTRNEESKEKENAKPSEKLQVSTATQGPLDFPVLPYTEPPWSGLPTSTGKSYVLEVLKEGRIIESIDLMKKRFWVFGRMINCDILKQHPSVSRYHAVIQYREIPSESEPQGFYLYDLGSTHGTFLNSKTKLKPKTYVRYQVGHVFRIGTSKRHYILTGPESDQEEESELSVTELKQLREQKIRDHQERMKQLELERELKRKQEEERGIDWGMGEEEAHDDDEIAENPFASTNNEELYLDDPKKALRGFFEREGLDMEYDCTEQGIGQFLCKVELPLDDEMGRPVVAEVLHRGKKKEAVVQCALEACRILDRAGILRQAIHESRKRKTKDWEENDFYDSDEDTFLDRTGTIEKKREKRMKVKQPEKAVTYESLVQKEKELTASIGEIEKKLGEAQLNVQVLSSNANADEDSLDSYMKGLSDDKPDKQTVSKLKMELANLRKEHANIIRLANLAKPADMPSLVPPSTSATGIGSRDKFNLPIFGKRKVVPVKYPAKPGQPEATQTSSEAVEEESDDETPTEVTPAATIASPGSPILRSLPDHVERLEELMPINSFHDTDTFRKFQEIIKSNNLPDIAEKHKQNLVKILRTLQRLASNEDRAHSDWKMLSVKTKKVMNWVAELRQRESDEKLQHMISTELSRILAELNEMTDDKFKAIDKVKGMGLALKTISMEIDKGIKELKMGIDGHNAPELESRLGRANQEVPEADAGCSREESQDDAADKKKRKNVKRIEHRSHKAELEKQKGYAEDASKEDYNMWTPPTDQSGDGRTKLNEKFGY